jgi:hypothetical protein
MLEAQYILISKLLDYAHAISRPDPRRGSEKEVLYLFLVDIIS